MGIPKSASTAATLGQLVVRLHRLIIGPVPCIASAIFVQFVD
jgi:hypothetical protein